MENKVEIYYDNFKSRQIKTGLNARHRFIITSLKRAGLKKHHHVWEIGCGIGVISGKLAKFVSKGNGGLPRTNYLNHKKAPTVPSSIAYHS